MQRFVRRCTVMWSSGSLCSCFEAWRDDTERARHAAAAEALRQEQAAQQAALEESAEALRGEVQTLEEQRAAEHALRVERFLRSTTALWTVRPSSLACCSGLSLA